MVKTAETEVWKMYLQYKINYEDYKLSTEIQHQFSHGQEVLAA